MIQMIKAIIHRREVAEQFQIASFGMHYVCQGGCGMFAHRMHQILSRMGVKTKLVAHQRTKLKVSNQVLIDIAENGTNNDNAGVLAHVTVKIGPFHFDDAGIFKPKQNGFRYRAEVGHEALKACLKSKKNVWNDTFSQSNDAKAISKFRRSKSKPCCKEIARLIT